MTVTVTDPDFNFVELDGNNFVTNGIWELSRCYRDLLRLQAGRPGKIFGDFSFKKV